MYLDSTKKAAARKDLIAEQIELNDKTSVFASQAESAISYNKFDDRIDGILVKRIDEINLNRENWEEIVDEAVEKIEGLKETAGSIVPLGLWNLNVNHIVGSNLLIGACCSVH